MVSALLKDPSYIEFLRTSQPDLRICELDTGITIYDHRADLAEALFDPAKRMMAQALQKIWPGLLTPKTVFFGLPFEPYIQDQLLSKMPSPSMLPSLARWRNADLIALTNISSRSSGGERLRELGFFALPSFPETVIDNPPSDFSTFIGGMDKKMRQSIRRNLRLFANKGHRIKEREGAEFFSDIHKAYRYALKKARFKWISYEKAYFAHLDHLGPKSLSLIATTENHQFLGFTNLLFDDDNAHICRLVVNENYSLQDSIFFCLLYKGIEHACQRRAKRIFLGPTAYRFKRRLGASLIFTQNYFIPISSVFQLIFKTTYKTMQKELNYLRSIEILEKYY